MRFRQFLEAEGVVTAENPDAQPASAKANAEANRRLRKDLQHLNPSKIRGFYNGNEEEAFQIPKIGKGTLIRLGKKYRQKAVVWNGKEIPTYSRGS